MRPPRPSDSAPHSRDTSPQIRRPARRSLYNRFFSPYRYYMTPQSFGLIMVLICPVRVVRSGSFIASKDFAFAHFAASRAFTLASCYRVKGFCSGSCYRIEGFHSGIMLSRQSSSLWHHFIKSLITSPAMMSPATDGTNATEPGVARLPGAGASLPSGASGGSFE